MDTKLSPTQVDPDHDGDVVVLAPKDWTDAEEALSRLAHVASDRRRPTAGSDFSAGPRATEPSLDATVRPPDLNIAPLPTDRPALGRRNSRSLARFLVTACFGVAATLAWQSYGGRPRDRRRATEPTCRSGVRAAGSIRASRSRSADGIGNGRIDRAHRPLSRVAAARDDGA
jgi:hypothetical protein